MKKIYPDNPCRQNFLHEPDDEQHKLMCEIYKDRAIIHSLSRVINEGNACEYALSQIRSARRKLQYLSNSVYGKDMILRSASSNQEVTFICTHLGKGDHKDLL